ncbi:MAG: hypothetical protein IPM52_13185 [Bacteroidetes bacterium]|nr:hypothetical protein [Bacteroidota bacterium]
MATIILAMTAGCKAPQPANQVPVMSRIELRPRLVPVHLPDDSALLRLQLECDSTKRVLITALDELKGYNVSTALQLAGSQLTYRSSYTPPVQHIAVRDSIVERQVPIEVVRTVEVNRLFIWQKTLMWLGIAFILIVALKIIGYVRL